MAAKLVTIGDSLTQGFQHGAIRRTAWSYPALVAQALGDSNFRQADFSGGGVGGPLLDLELSMRRLSDACGSQMSLWELPTAALTLRSFMSRVEDYWERGRGTEPSTTGPIHHNLAVWGFEVLDALTLSDAVCLRNTPPATDNWLGQIPEHGMYRSARRVQNPAQLPELRECNVLQLAHQLAESQGIENLIVALGSNNALGTCVRLALAWSESADVHKLSHQRSCTIWEPAHFELVYRDLAEQVTQVGAQRVFLTTVPHLTVAPVTRGVSPRARERGTAERLDGYYEYYTRFWIWDEHFDPARHPHLTREDVRLIDRVIDDYNTVIKKVAAERGFHVIDWCGVLDALAFRRSGGHPSYVFPDALRHALQNDPATAFRVRADGTVLLDTRYLEIPNQPPPDNAPSSAWQDAYHGGLFGLDGVHPTTIGYGIIAHEVLKVMQAARVPNADPAHLPWHRIVAADSLIQEPPAILASLQRTLDLLFGKLALERLIEKVAGYGAEPL